MMGITDFTIKSKSQYGTLREATLSIKANSPEQLDIIEKLYFKPGFTMLLEWGNSHYLDNLGQPTTAVNSVTKRFLVGKSSIKRIQKEITKLVSSSGNNYDAMIGKVVNFSWDYAEDGGYDCKVNILGKGEVIESIRSTFFTGADHSTGHRKYGQRASQKTEKDDRDLLLEVLQAFTNWKEKEKYIEEFWKDSGIKVYRSSLANADVDDMTGEEETTDYQFFFTLGDFLHILNKEILSKDFSGADGTLFDTDRERQEYITYPGHISSDPYICGIPYSAGGGGKGAIDGYSHWFGGTEDLLGKLYNNGAIIPKELSASKDLKTGRPLNTLINIAYLQNLQRSALKNLRDNNKETSIFQLVKTVLKDVSLKLGSINNLDLHLDKQANEWYVIDRNLYNPVKHDESLPLINVVGLGSSMTSLSLSSKISGKMASMLSIAAAAGGGGQDNFVQFNNGAVDRFAKAVDVNNETKEFPVDSMSKHSTRYEASKRIAKAYYSYATKKETDPENFDAIASTHRELTAFSLQMHQLKSRADSKPKATNILLPIEMNLSMKGIAGLKMGEAFTITPEILPERYRGRVGFVITGLSHKIGSDNMWTVDVKTNMFMLPIRDTSIDMSNHVEQAPVDTKEPEEPPVETSEDTPNADKFRAAIKAAGFIEKLRNLSGGGDITSDTLKLGTALIRAVQKEAPGIKLRFTAGNDAWHQTLKNSNSRHKKGRALDFTVEPHSTDNYLAILPIVQGFAAGNSSELVRYLDEYEDLTAHGTGAHFHFSWGRGTEGMAYLRQSQKLAAAGKIKKFTV